MTSKKFISLPWLKRQSLTNRLTSYLSHLKDDYNLRITKTDFGYLLSGANGAVPVKISAEQNVNILQDVRRFSQEIKDLQNVVSDLNVQVAIYVANKKISDVVPENLRFGKIRILADTDYDTLYLGIWKIIYHTCLENDLNILLTK